MRSCAAISAAHWDRDRIAPARSAASYAESANGLTVCAFFLCLYCFPSNICLLKAKDSFTQILQFRLQRFTLLYGIKSRNRTQGWDDEKKRKTACISSVFYKMKPPSPLRKERRLSAFHRSAHKLISKPAPFSERMSGNHLLPSYAFFLCKTIFSPKNRPLIAPNPDRLPVAEYRKTWYHVI